MYEHIHTRVEKLQALLKVYWPEAEAGNAEAAQVVLGVLQQWPDAWAAADRLQDAVVQELQRRGIDPSEAVKKAE